MNIGELKLPSLRTQLALAMGTGLLLWLVFYLGQAYLKVQSEVWYVAGSVLFTTAMWAGCYLIVVLLWRLYPWSSHAAKHLLIEVLAISGYSIGLHQLAYGVVHVPQPEGYRFVTTLITLFITLLITSLHEAYFFYRQWQLNFSRSVRLEKENLLAQYQTLRQQLNPHFLFNSLNSLLHLVEGQPRAEAYVQHLAELLRYTLQSTEQPLVPLQQELAVAEHYVALQQVRFEDKLQVNKLLPDPIPQMQIPPLVLQMLLENCVKHNIVSSTRPLQIHIELQGNILRVCNNWQPRTDSPAPGFGLKNIEERYRLFGAALPTVKRENGYFCVEVPLIELAE